MKTNIFIVMGLMVVTAACTVKAVGDPNKPITIKAHVVIDIREMKNTATSIEDQVAAQAVPGNAAAQPQRLSMLSVARKLWEPAYAYAEGGYDLKEVTPEIQEALERRSGRYNALAILKGVGKIGENNEGHVENLTADADAMKTVQAENRDREIIYQAIVAQNDLPANSIHTVRAVFADVQAQKAKPGEKIQTSEGKWITKS